MKAIVQERYGPPEALELRDIERPVPGAGEVLVRVRAASLNAYDWHFMRGDPMLGRPTMGFTRPRVRVRGRDFAGEVEAVGSGVTALKPGEEVFGQADGTLAEFVCARADEVGPKPANLGFEQAAAIPLAGNTALMCLRDTAGTQQGQRVLVNGASGGVGTFAVQIAKADGAEVTAVCSARNAGQARALGADHVVDYTREDFTRSGRRYDIVLDLVGNHSLGALRRALTPTGTLVLSGGGVYEGGSVVGPMGLFLKRRLLSPLVRGQRLLECAERIDTAHLATLRELAEAGTVVPVVERTYPLSEAVDALRYLETEHARAKIVVTV
ncbi:NAD(P)-dependent alcohol dehydrogenase [Streptomyces sp. NPDC018693]|uniref:NAD(P)-dependent alcohol dehydrogenase n=1 Tax=unclassified Streptomyces TaxID=2593676 RepID=UPI0037922CCF